MRSSRDDRSRNQIPNKDLKLSDLPDRHADWQDFALTFHGYEIHKSFEACAKIANRQAPKTLTEYRTCLFFEQRRWRHFGEVPKGKDLAYIRSLLDGIRAIMKKKETP